MHVGKLHAAGKLKDDLSSRGHGAAVQSMTAEYRQSESLWSAKSVAAGAQRAGAG